MDKRGMRQCTPRNNDPSVMPESFVDMHSGYIQRALAKLPKQGNKAPWKVYMNYFLDLPMLRYRPIEDGSMELSNPKSAGRAKAKAKAA
jgi:monooxygenase